MRVVSSLSLAFIVLSSFFSFGCFLRLAARLFWLRFVLFVICFFCYLLFAIASDSFAFTSNLSVYGIANVEAEDS